MVISVTPVLSKLMMCVCAAGTGAAIVPAVHVAQRHFSPHHAAVHRPGRRARGATLAIRPDCLPGVTAAGGGLGGGGSDGMTSLGLAADVAPGRDTDGFPFGGFSRLPDGGGGDGAGPGGGPGSSIPSTPVVPGQPTSPPTPSGPAGPIVPGPPSAPGIPSISNAPEPASWLLMVAGFGLTGGLTRHRRVRAV